MNKRIAKKIIRNNRVRSYYSNKQIRAALKKLNCSSALGYQAQASKYKQMTDEERAIEDKRMLDYNDLIARAANHQQEMQRKYQQMTDKERAIEDKRIVDNGVAFIMNRDFLE